MRSGRVETQVRAIAAVRSDSAATPDQIREALRDVSGVRAWLASSEAALTKALASQVSFPERDVADCTRGSLHDAIKTKERSDTLDRSPSLADALDRADITAGHVDDVTKTITSLDSDDQRAELIDRVDGEGMVCLSGRFDPITGRRIVARLDATTQALFAEATPDRAGPTRSRSNAVSKVSRWHNSRAAMHRPAAPPARCTTPGGT